MLCCHFENHKFNVVLFCYIYRYSHFAANLTCLCAANILFQVLTTQLKKSAFATTCIINHNVDFPSTTFQQFLLWPFRSPPGEGTRRPDLGHNENCWLTPVLGFSITTN